MAYTNSELVAYKKISPSKNSPRRYGIDTITIHVVEGQVTSEALGATFSNPERQASANYGVDKDGRIGLYVEEKDRAWTSGSGDNDHRAITIEVASDPTPPYKVSDITMNALIELLVDICKRNKIPALLWKNDPALIYEIEQQNMTVHRWFQDTSCPGEYMMGKMGEIADRVNEKLGVFVQKEEQKEESVFKPSLVQIKEGAFYTNGVSVPSQYIGKTYNAVKKIDTRYLISELTSWVDAQYLHFVEEETQETKPVKKNIEVGNLVKMVSGAVYTNGVKVPQKYIGKPYTVAKVESYRALISELNSWVSLSYLKLAGEEVVAPKKEWKDGAKVKINKGAVYTNGVPVPSGYIGGTFTIQQYAEPRALLKELYSWVEKKHLTLL